jgi:hypothetical protein
VSNRVQRKASAKERVREMQAAQARAERRRRLVFSGAAVAFVVIVIVALIVARLSGVGSGGSGAASGQASASLIKDIHDIPASTFDKAGTSGASGGPSKISAPDLTAGGKPRVLYVGAEYCPYCAAERWAFAAALSRFGTFSTLGTTHSSSADVDPNTPTLSFHDAKYASDLISFTGVETTSNKRTLNGYQSLDKLTGTDNALVDKYDQPPYVQGSSGGIPFIDIGGKYVSSGATYDPGLLAGMSHAAVAKAMNDPSSKVGQAIDGSANLFTAAICQTTGSKPAAVCQSPGVRAALTKIDG